MEATYTGNENTQEDPLEMTDKQLHDTKTKITEKRRKAIFN